MIYMDVSSCTLPMNFTGVPRVVRGLYRHLSQRAEVIPVVWDPWLYGYSKLSRREASFLNNPFGGLSPEAMSKMDRSEKRSLILEKIWRRFAHGLNRIDLVTKLGEGDTLFIPEFCWDNRIRWLRRLKSRTSARSVAVFHDAVPWKYPGDNPRLRPSHFLKYMQALSEVSEVIAVSGEAADDLKESWSLLPNRAERENFPEVIVRHWPIDDQLALDAARSREICIDDGIPPKSGVSGAPEILYVSSLEQRKNHMNLLTACEYLWDRGRNFRLILIGRCLACHGEKVRSRVEEMIQNGRPLEWRRRVSDRTLSDSYRNCLFTVFPSLHEGYGLPIVESLAYQRPCICGDKGAVREAGEGGGCLFIDQTNPENIADAIDCLLMNPKKLESLRHEAAVRKFVSWPEYIEKIIPILNSSR